MSRRRNICVCKAQEDIITFHLHHEPRLVRVCSCRGRLHCRLLCRSIRDEFPAADCSRLQFSHNLLGRVKVGKAVLNSIQNHASSVQGRPGTIGEPLVGPAPSGDHGPEGAHLLGGAARSLQGGPAMSRAASSLRINTSRAASTVGLSRAASRRRAPPPPPPGHSLRMQAAPRKTCPAGLANSRLEHQLRS